MKGAWSLQIQMPQKCPLPTQPWWGHRLSRPQLLPTPALAPPPVQPPAPLPCLASHPNSCQGPHPGPDPTVAHPPLLSPPATALRLVRRRDLGPSLRPGLSLPPLFPAVGCSGHASAGRWHGQRHHQHPQLGLGREFHPNLRPVQGNRAQGHGHSGGSPGPQSQPRPSADLL